MLHDIEKLKKAHEESLKEALEANRIALALPTLPKRVGFANSTVPWVTYEVGTLKEALDIFGQYIPTPYVIARSSCFTTILTMAEFDRRKECERDKYETDTELDGAPHFDCLKGESFETNEMVFFTNAAGRDLKITVKIANSPIRVRLLIRNDRARDARERYSKDYPSVPGANVIRWSYGDDCVKGTYWFGTLDAFEAAMGTFTEAANAG